MKAPETHLFGCGGLAGGVSRCRELGEVGIEHGPRQQIGLAGVCRSRQPVAVVCGAADDEAGVRGHESEANVRVQEAGPLVITTVNCPLSTVTCGCVGHGNTRCGVSDLSQRMSSVSVIVETAESTVKVRVQ